MTKISQGFQQFYVIFPIVNKSCLVKEQNILPNLGNLSHRPFSQKLCNDLKVKNP